MSAVRFYNDLVNEARTDRIVPSLDLIDAADAAIAELQAELEAKLSALKARRCETCDEWDGPMGTRQMGKCCVWTINSSPANPGCGKTHFRDTPASGFCYRWKLIRSHDE